MTGSGGTGTSSYSVSPSLPTGLSINSSTRAISGTPTATSAATSYYAVTVTDSNGATATASFSLTVNTTVAAATAVVASRIADPEPCNGRLHSSDGLGRYGNAELQCLSCAASGLSFNASTGAISGTPTATSTAASYTVTVTDSNSATATASFSLTMSGAVTATSAIVFLYIADPEPCSSPLHPSDGFRQYGTLTTASLPRCWRV